MKFTSLKLATALTLTAITAFANADTTEEMIYNDKALFDNKLAAQITNHRPLDVEAVAKLIQKPSRDTLQTNLGPSKNVSQTDEVEIWFYGLEIPTTTNSKEKCIVAFQFDLNGEQRSPVADFISFDKAACENVVVQQLHKNHHNN